ncbi:hemerythrin domain-containing protein [Streptosporangium sp. NPDC048047]|uniref:hemerythrin domain-containing protein n=1 Tax=Streptosporangium sp. NPDC048047 TaxID=3155748 RepID=UPI00343CBA01
MARDVISMIIADHRDIRAVLGRLRREPAARPALLVELAARLVAHDRGEEEIVYPEITRVDPREAEHALHATAEHQRAEQMILSLLDIAPGAAEFESRLDDLTGVVTRHFAAEEEGILPALAAALPRNRLEELGHAFARLTAEEIRIGLSAGNR